MLSALRALAQVKDLHKRREAERERVRKELCHQAKETLLSLYKLGAFGRERGLSLQGGGGD